MSTYTIVMKLANNLMILLQSFPYVCPFPSCEFRHLVFQKKSPDADYRFITIDVGSVGRFGDGNIFSSSMLAKKLKKQTLQLPLPAMLPNVVDPLPYIFVGDEAFPLSENLMRPYPKRNVTGNYEN
jgi:hypothetical protein